MPETVVLYFGQRMRVACDGQCWKAWGRNTRPRVYLSLTDEDDYAFKADHELARAPRDPGTYEGVDAKPPDASHFPNRWCVRECERAARSEPGKWRLPLVLPDFDERVYNRRAGEGG